MSAGTGNVYSVCVLEAITGSKALYGKETFRGDVILESDVASLTIPLEFLPEKSFIWAESRNMESITYGANRIVPSSDLSQTTDRYAAKAPHYINSVRRDDVTTNDEFVFEVQFVQPDYEKYSLNPDRRVFNIYFKQTTKRMGADITIEMCGAKKVCVLSGNSGYYGYEDYRTDAVVKDGRVTFSIPSSKIPDSTLWSFIPLEKSLWSISLDER